MAQRAGDVAGPSVAPSAYIDDLRRERFRPDFRAPPFFLVALRADFRPAFFLAPFFLAGMVLLR
jgi:hypothetical protein